MTTVAAGLGRDVPFKKRGKKSPARAKRLKDDRRRPKEISHPEQGRQNRDTLIKNPKMAQIIINKILKKKKSIIDGGALL